MEKQEFEPVSIHYDAEENPDGVRVIYEDEDFIIALHDAFEYPTEWYLIKEDQIKTFNVWQARAIDWLIDEINQKLVEAGGDSLAGKYYWTADAGDPGMAIYINGTTGYYDDGYKESLSHVRECVTNKTHRSR